MGVVDIPVVAQRQIPMVQTVQKTIEIPQLQYIDKVVDVPVVQVVQVPRLQVVEKIVEVPEIQTVQGTQTSESLGTAPVRQVAQAEIVEVVEMGAPLPAESAPPMFVTAPVLEAPPAVVEYVQPAPVVEYVAPAPAVTFAHATAAPVVEYWLQPRPLLTRLQ